VQDYEKDTKRWKSRKFPFDIFGGDEMAMTGREEFRIIFLVIVGLLGERQKRLVSYI
jgi:hypothetical protein